MRITKIYDRNGWELISYGNGSSYTLRQFRPSGSYSCSIQGDDAEEFREAFDACLERGLDPRDRLFVDYTEVMDRD